MNSTSCSAVIRGTSARLRGLLSGRDLLLHVAAHHRRREVDGRGARPHAREEVRRPVALVRGQRRGIHDPAALSGHQLHAPGPDALSLAGRARLVDDERAALAVDDHRKGGLGADLHPARLEQSECARVGKDRDRAVLRGEAWLARRRRHRRHGVRHSEQEATEDSAVPAIVHERAAAVAVRVVEPVAELR